MGFNLIDFRVYGRSGSECLILGRETKTCLGGLVSEAGVLAVFAFIITQVNGGPLSINSSLKF